MFKRAVLLYIIVLQFVRLACSIGPVDITDLGTSMNFNSAIAQVNCGLRGNFNPIKTLLDVSACMANPNSQSQPARKNSPQRPVETNLILSTLPQFVKTNTTTGAGFDIGILAMLLFMVLLLNIFGREGLVLCRVQHLFARAREGICSEYLLQPRFAQSLR
jgi:hypothetical protein